MKDNSLLKISHLEAGYGAIQVLWDINLEVKQKEVVCVIGANGAGKSTLLKNIVGIIPSFKGEIFYSGNNITKMASPERIKMGLGFAPEGRHLFFGLTV
ncbi:MAG: ATP-binding cassette domain-containing protein, partial [Candidatus Caldatribacteriota bacterium]|nr:ATP-binding cassette domain-containing protein [Candidatus Caldatribacteriota bacterium]